MELFYRHAISVWSVSTFVALLSLVLSPLPALAETLAVHPEYEKCEPGKNDYLERYLQEMAARDVSVSKLCSENPDWPVDDATIGLAKGLLSKIDPSKVPSQCVIQAMLNKGPRMPGAQEGVFTYEFAFCGSDWRRIVDRPNCKPSAQDNCRVRKPCISEMYHRYAYNSFNEAMKCLGIDPFEMFPIFAREGGFHPNIGSGSGAWGSAMLTDAGVAQVNELGTLEKLREKPECQNIKGALAKPMPAAGSDGYWGTARQDAVCQTITPPTGAIKSFIYGGLLYQDYRKRAENILAAWTNPQLAEGTADRRLALIEMTRTMYNTGPKALKEEFDAFIAARGDAPMNFKEFRDNFRKHLSRSFGMTRQEKARHNELYKKGASDRNAEEAAEWAALEKKRMRRSEVGTYTQHIDEQTSLIEKQTGSRCGI